jgi:hypothetical protein
LKGKIRVVASPNVSNVGGGVAVAGESHPFCHGDVWIVRDLAQSKLAPAMISEKMAVFNASLFVDSLAKLRGKKIIY